MRHEILRDWPDHLFRLLDVSSAPGALTSSHLRLLARCSRPCELADWPCSERRHVRGSFPPRLVSSGFKHPGVARALDRKYQRRMDDAGSVSRPRTIDGARVLRLHPARGFDLCRAELEELARDLSQERHVGTAP